MGRGEATALYLPLLLLVRGRLTEALAAHARLLRSGVPSGPQGARAPSLCCTGPCSQST